jgi:hypothetical protein
MVGKDRHFKRRVRESRRKSTSGDEDRKVGEKGRVRSRSRD